MTKREPYWDYMMRRTCEERVAGNDIMNTEDIMKREIFEMQKCMQNLMKRQKELSDTIYDLSYKVKLLGGDPRQQELKF
jgi:hypothetical protein|tara:strand:- start:611 stop:847 length:237 start_codon:yes stop_codon:yes gene_type:complete